MTHYLEEYAPGKPSYDLIRYHMRALAPFWGDKSMADIKGATCRAYGKSRPVKPATVRRELKTLQAAIGFWKREAGLAAIPQVTLPAEGERRERFLERDEVAGMLRACRRLKLPHVARFIIIGYNTGTRHDAILKCRWSPSLSGGHIDLARGIMFRRGSAERETSKRRLPVAIGRRLHSQMARWRVLDDDDISHVIHFRDQRILKLKRAWHSVVTEAGLGRDVTPHVLRHTCATWALWGREAKGLRPETPPMTIWDVAGMIGADATTVERTYGHHRRIEAGARRRA